MLTREENEYLCRVGPGTPMGDLLRRYWIPACPASDLPEPDCAPVRVRRLGQDLVAFRDSDGRLGVLDEQCCHRGASLCYGRVEDRGIRCLYHGWKYAVDGTILETPNMPDSRFRERVKAPAYPVHEVGDVIWVYLGPPGKQPPAPDYVWTRVPSSHRFVFEFIQEHCNWVQALEGGMDSSHVGILHGDEVALMTRGEYDPQGVGRDRYPSTDNAPVLEVQNTNFGLHYAALRQALEPGRHYVRITPYIMPFMTYPAGGAGVMRVPRDDESTAVITAGWRPEHEEPPDLAYVLRREGMDRPEVYGPDRVLRIPEQDREAMRRRESFTGIVGFNPQDGAMTMSMGGPIFDRSREHVVPADYAILRMRRLLIEWAGRVAEGEDPPGVTPDVATGEITGAGGVIDRGASWQALVPGNVVTEEVSRRGMPAY